MSEYLGWTLEVIGGFYYASKGYQLICSSSLDLTLWRIEARESQLL